jgi:hypothetical protein
MRPRWSRGERPSRTSAGADFPARHAYLVSRTLYEHRASIPDARPLKAAVGALPIHPGTLAYQRGEPLPASAD